MYTLGHANDLSIRSLAWLFGALVLCMMAVQAGAEEPVPIGRSPNEPIVPSKDMRHEDHSKHREMLKQKHYTRSEQNYKIPDIHLKNMQGEDIRLKELLDSDEPVLLQFIFTTCTTICPVMSASFASAQDRLRAIGPEFKMVSISIDPDQDTPRMLHKYAQRFKAGAQWHFLTGSRENIAVVQKAFGAYYPGNNKMYHQPYTYLRGNPERAWIRIDGLMSAADLVSEYRKVLRRSEIEVSWIGLEGMR